MGCPAREEKVEVFIQILEKATKISITQKTSITERLKMNRN
jgi:hypothetical protein